MIAPAFTDVRIFMMLISFLGIASAPRARRSPVVRNTYVPHMIWPAFTDVRIFMMLTSFVGVAAARGRNDPGCQEPLRSPDDRAAFHGCANLHADLLRGNRRTPDGAATPVVRNSSVSPNDRAGFHRCTNLHGAELLPLLLHAFDLKSAASPRTHPIRANLGTQGSRVG
jgi:hypothetical protein